MGVAKRQGKSPQHHGCQGSVITSVLSCHSKDFKRRTLKPSASHSSRTARVIVLGQISLISKIKENTSSRRGDMLTQKMRKEEKSTLARWLGERERPGPLAPLFICFFLSLGLPYVNWASQECVFHLRSSLPSSDPPLFYFRGLFPSLSFQFSSVSQSCPTLCNPMNHSTPGLPVHHQLLEFTQIHVH